MLFSIEYQLCKEFPAFTPFEIERTTFHNVIRLYSEVRDMQIRNEKAMEKAEKRAKRIANGDEIIRRPAGDNWF